MQELISKRSEIIEQMEALYNDAAASVRAMSEQEISRWNDLDKEQKDLEIAINQRKQLDELATNKILNENLKSNSKMRNFNEMIVRNGDKVENFKVRALDLTSGAYDSKVGENISVVGYEPFYKQMGVEVLPNLASAIKLPYIDAVVAGKMAEGEPKQLVINCQQLVTKWLYKPF